MPVGRSGMRTGPITAQQPLALAAPLPQAPPPPPPLPPLLPASAALTQALARRARSMLEEFHSAGGAQCDSAVSELLACGEEDRATPGAGTACIYAALCMQMESKWRGVGPAALPHLVKAGLLTPLHAQAACAAFFAPAKASAGEGEEEGEGGGLATFHTVELPMVGEHCVAVLQPLVQGSVLPLAALAPLLRDVPSSASSMALNASGGYILAALGGGVDPALTAPGPLAFTGPRGAAVARAECRLSAALAACAAPTEAAAPLQAALALRPALLRLALPSAASGNSGADAGEELRAQAAVFFATPLAHASAQARTDFVRVLIGEAGAAAAWAEFDAGTATACQVAERCREVLGRVLALAGGGADTLAAARQALRLAAGCGEWMLGAEPSAVAEALCRAFEGVLQAALRGPRGGGES